MRKNRHTLFIACLLLLCCSCNKETAINTPAVSTLSTVVSTKPAGKYFIGEHFGGGIIFYIDSSGKHGLIATSADFEEPAVWSQKDTLNGAKNTTMYAGAGNTQRIVKTQGYPQFEADDYAALECLTLILNGYQDWYLPSKDELNKMYENKTAIGGFRQFSYWSSSESNVSKAWFQNFNTGSQALQLKTASYTLRPVRKF